MLKRESLESLARAYQRRVQESAVAYASVRPKQLPNPWIGEQAQNTWLKEDLPKHGGIRKKSIGIDPSTAVSNRGNPRRTDAIAIIAGEMTQFELKKSRYQNERVRDQLAAQLFDLGLGTYGATTLNVIYAQEGRVDVYTRDQAEEAVKAALDGDGEFEVPAPALVIELTRPESAVDNR
jgi:hypothetical protein